MSFSHYRRRDSTVTFGVSAPKTTEWRGTVDGTFGTAGNWTNGVPVTSDTVIFNYGSVDLDSDLSQSGITLEWILIHHHYQGRIGTAAGSPLNIHANVVQIDKEFGAVHLSGSYGTVRVANTAGGDNAITVTSKGTGFITDFIVQATQGELKLNSPAKIQNLYATTSPGQASRITAKTGTGPYALLRLQGNAFMTSLNHATDAEIDGGGLTLTSTSTTAALEITGGGTVEHDGSGTITALTVRDGNYTVRDNDSDTVTVTDAYTYPGSILDLRTNINALVVTNDIDYWGGTILFDEGQALQLA